MQYKNHINLEEFCFLVRLELIEQGLLGMFSFDSLNHDAT